MSATHRKLIIPVSTNIQIKYALGIESELWLKNSNQLKKTLMNFILSHFNSNYKSFACND